MGQQITRTLTVRIWADKGKRLPKDYETTDRMLDDAIAHAAEQIAQGMARGQIIEEGVNGWWETSTKDER